VTNTADSRPNDFHFPNHIATGRERPCRAAWVGALAHEDVGEPDAGGEYTQAHLAESWLWQWILDKLEDVRPAAACGDDTTVGAGAFGDLARPRCGEDGFGGHD
jgi:hypothetical protein